jgi:hypothetical protein
LLAFVKLQRIIWEFKLRYIIANTDLLESLLAFSVGRFIPIMVDHANPAWSTRKKVGRIVRKIILFRKNIITVAVSSHLRVWLSMIAPNHVNKNPIYY